MVRSRLISLLLTLVVGLGLATSAFAHRLPTADELQLQTLQALGLVSPAALCGDSAGKGPAPCADDNCGLCAATSPTLLPEVAAFSAPVPRLRALAGWPEAAAVPLPFVARAPLGQGPPVTA